MTGVGRVWRVVGCAVALLLVAVSCSSNPPAAAEQQLPDRQVTADPTPTPRPGPNDPKPEPMPYIPGPAVGDATAYDELVAELESTIPVALRSQVPWPDLRNPDPKVAQLEIFDLWIWMSENHPDPQLVALMAAPDSPNRPGIITTFAELFGADWLSIRPGSPYRAYAQQAITFESAGLPLWLARDVPADAVVIYYTDESGPVETRDRITGAVVDRSGSVPPRDWVSIMVETEVGWLLWRDQIIEPGDPELETPNDVPSSEPGQQRPEV